MRSNAPSTNCPLPVARARAAPPRRRAPAAMPCRNPPKARPHAPADPRCRRNRPRPTSPAPRRRSRRVRHKALRVRTRCRPPSIARGLIALTLVPVQAHRLQRLGRKIRDHHIGIARPAGAPPRVPPSFIGSQRQAALVAVHLQEHRAFARRAVRFLAPAVPACGPRALHASPRGSRRRRDRRAARRNRARRCSGRNRPREGRRTVRGFGSVTAVPLLECPSPTITRPPGNCMAQPSVRKGGRDFARTAMPPKRNPLNLNPLQLRTLTLLQAIARIPGAARGAAQWRSHDRPVSQRAWRSFPSRRCHRRGQGRKRTLQ